MTASAELFHGLVIGAINDLTCSRLDDPAAPMPSLAGVLTVCGRAASDSQLGERWRWRGHEVARVVGSYLQHLCPPAGFGRIASDTADVLWWANDQHVFADVVSSRRADARLWTRHSSGLPRRLVRTAQEIGDTRFAGVRLLAPMAPTRSLLVNDRAKSPSLLTASLLWFGSPTESGLDLAASSSGEVA